MTKPFSMKSQQKSRGKKWNLYIAKISMVENHLNILTNMVKTTFYFGGISQFTDNICFEAQIKCSFWLTTFCRHAIEFWFSSKQLWQLNLQF